MWAEKLRDCREHLRRQTKACREPLSDHSQRRKDDQLQGHCPGAMGPQGVLEAPVSMNTGCVDSPVHLVKKRGLWTPLL